MRVGIVLESFHQMGGVERRTSMLVRELLDSGDEVHVFTRRWAADAPEQVHFHQVRSKPLIRALRPLFFAMRAQSLARRQQLDLVHSQTRLWEYDVATLGVGCHRAYVQARCAPGSKPSLDSLDRVSLWLERRMLRDLSRRIIITNSEMTRRDLVAWYGCPAERIRVVHNGVDPFSIASGDIPQVRGELRQELGLAEEDVVVLFVGTGFRRKGLEDLVRGIGRLSHPMRSRVRLVVVGAGDQTPCLRLAKGIGLQHLPLFAGKRPDTPRFYAAADIFALPTLYDPFANSTMEALAAGLPVITTTMNGVSEILREGQTGFVVGSRSSESIAEALARLVEDGELRRRVGHAGQDLVRDCTWRRTAEETRKVYDEVLSLRGQAS